MERCLSIFERREQLLLSDLIKTVAGFRPRRLDCDLVLLARGGDGSAHTMRLPISGSHDFGERRTVGAFESFPESSLLCFQSVRPRPRARIFEASGPMQQIVVQLSPLNERRPSIT